MKRNLPKKPRKARVRHGKAAKLAPPTGWVLRATKVAHPVMLPTLTEGAYRWSFGAYWCRSIGLFPVIEPYINAGGVNGYGFGIRVAWFGGNAYAEWWKP